MILRKIYKEKRKIGWLLSSILLFTGILGAPMRAHAAFNLHLTDINDKEVIFPVDDKLHFCISDSSLVLSSAGDEITLSIDDLKGIKYTGFSGVDEIALSRLPQVRFSDNAVIIVSPDESVGKFMIYSTEGHNLMQGEFQGETRVLFSAFDKGVYILQIENSPAIKFVIR